MLVFKSFDDSVSVLLTKFLSQSGGNLSSNLSHDLHVGSLGNFLTDFNKVSFGIGLFNSGLCDILIKNLPVELFGVAINQIVIEFTSMGFHKIWLTGGGIVGEMIRKLTMMIDTLFVHNFLVRESSVLHGYESLCGRSMFSKRWWGNTSAAPTIFSDIVIHNPVESVIVSSDTLLLSNWEHLIKELIIFSLNGSCLSL